MRLIDDNTLADVLFEKRKNYPQWVADTIENIPDAVVKCKDCKFRGNTSICPLAYIEKTEQFTALCVDEWFCGNGKRKEGR